MMRDHNGPCRCPLCTTPSPRIAALALIALTACADTGDDTAELERFTPRPIQVQASSELPEECVLSLLDAQAYFRDRSVSLALTSVDPGATSQLGIAVSGVIAVKPGKLATFPNRVHGETAPFHSIGGALLAAEITLASCEVHAVAHEIGHALLGPQHRSTRENLMNGELAQAGWVLDVDQLAAIRD